jgi:hypothetical protein
MGNNSTSPSNASLLTYFELAGAAYDIPAASVGRMSVALSAIFGCVLPCWSADGIAL